MIDRRPNFDLPILLKLSDLDIRRVAEEKQLLTVRDYFDLLARFLDIEPKLKKTLTKIADCEGEEKDFLLLAEEKVLLEELGYVKLSPIIDNINSAGKKGELNSASEAAKQSMVLLNNLFTRTEMAIKARSSESPADESDAGDVMYNFMSRNPDATAQKTLKEVLSQIDIAEANRKLCILAVDDSTSTLKTISLSLKDQYKVFTLPDPTQVKRFLQQVTPELFLLDYKMPELSGFELVPIIRGFEEHKNTPIIFMTSQGTKSNLSVAAMLGAADFIVKPFDGFTLREKIEKHIVKKKSF